MVKPSKNMEPEAVDLVKAGRAAGKAFEEDSFRNYMARKIDMQRQQFGLELPPPPSPPPQKTSPNHKSTSPSSLSSGSPSKKNKNAHVSFAANVKDNHNKPNSSSSSGKRKRRSKSKGPMSTLLKKLKRRHGSGLKPPSRRRKRRSQEPEKENTETIVENTASLQQSNNNNEASSLQEEEEQTTIAEEPTTIATSSSQSPNQEPIEQQQETSQEPIPSQLSDENDEEQPEEKTTTRQSTSKLCRTAQIARERPDLFFLGVVVMVNGYTHPDTETLQRLLHKHGGDLEKYETSRITHIVAEHLSTAKANIYKRMRRPLPVVNPSWVVDCVQAGKRLAHGDYLLEEVRDQKVHGMKSYFGPAAKESTGVISPNKSPEEKENSMAESSKLTDTGIDAEPTEQKSSSAADDDAKGEAPFHQGSDHHAASSLMAVAKTPTTNAESPSKNPTVGKTDDKFINGKIRTVGTDPNFLESFFHNSRLSFIGSYKQRIQESPSKKQGHNSSAGEDKVPKQRFVFHADMDCFFAAVVLRNYPQYRNKPVAISHFGKTDQNHQQPKKNSSSECATCNYEARKFGIQKGMFLGRAKELCPNLVILPYDFDGYEEVSEQVAVILQRYSEAYNGEVEQVSCDESYLELFFPEGEGLQEPHRVAGEVANAIRQEILETTRCTATIGVGANKFLAKLATDRVKPNGSFVVRRHTELLRNLKLRDLHGIGYRTDRKLVEEGLVSVQDVWDLGEHGESELVRILGQGLGKKIWAFCKGEDDRPVKEAERKTIGAECNYGVRFDGPYGVDCMIEGLAKEVQKRMEGVGCRGSQVTLKIKQRKQGAKPAGKFLGHGSCHSLSKSQTINGGATRDWKVFAEIGKTLFAEMNVEKDDVRGMGIVVSKLDTASAETVSGRTSKQSITNWFGAAKSNDAKTPVAKEQDTNGNEAGESPPFPMLVQEPEPRESFQNIFDKSTKDHCPKERLIPSFSQIEDYDKYQEQPPPVDGKTQDNCLDADDDNNNIALEMMSDGSSEKDDKNTATDRAARMPQAENDFGDVALPPLSQIHLSQVEALPSPLRKQINSKIAAQRSLVEESQQPRRRARSLSFDNITTNNKRLRQVSVKRMFRLAEVKAGKSNNSISVDELKNLPLELQLQVANNDNCPLGDIAPSGKKGRTITSRKKARRGLQSPRAATSSSRNKRQERRPKSSDKESHPQEETGVSQEEQEAVAHPEVAKEDFFEDNVLPLCLYMDENKEPAGDALDQVSEFLCLCIKENRLRDAVLLLRNIKSRSDCWGRIAFGHLLDVVDRTCEEEKGYRLDKDGLGLA